MAFPSLPKSHPNFDENKSRHTSTFRFDRIRDVAGTAQELKGRYGGGDRRLILAEDGEFIVNKEAYLKHAPVVNAINNGTVPRFQSADWFREFLLPVV